MKNTRLIPKGEHLFKEGDPARSIFVIQSGRVSVYTQKSKKTIELYQASNMQVLGEEAAFGSPKYGASAVLKSDCKVLEVPVELIRTQIGQVNQVIQVFLNSLVEKIKNFKTEIRDYKMEHDTTPCPPDSTASTFGSIFHTVRYSGEKLADGKYRIAWAALKKYAQRIFGLSPVKCENATFCLVKLDLASIEMVKDPTDPDGEEEIGFIVFNDLKKIEDFFEYYQNYHFKGVDANFLKPDEKTTKMVEALIKVSEKGKTDKNGVVWLNFKDAMDELKKYLGPTFDADKFALLEQKGLFVNRKSDDKGGMINFYKQEFEGMLNHWGILRMIDVWNDLGAIDVFAEETKEVVEDYSKCPSCKADTGPAQKFCAQCGLDLVGVRSQKAA